MHEQRQQSNRALRGAPTRADQAFAASREAGRRIQDGCGSMAGSLVSSQNNEDEHVHRLIINTFPPAPGSTEGQALFAIGSLISTHVSRLRNECSIAQQTAMYANSQLAESDSMRDEWEKNAAHFHDSARYYRSLLEQIGGMLGDDAFKQDDGGDSRTMFGDDPEAILVAKIPELIAARLGIEWPQPEQATGQEPAPEPDVTQNLASSTAPAAAEAQPGQ